MTDNDNNDKDVLYSLQLKRLEELKNMGLTPFGQKFDKKLSIEDLRSVEPEEGKKIQTAGRIMACRNMGKTRFWDIADKTGRIQLFIHPKVLNEEKFDIIAKLGVGDIIGVNGELFVTRTGELSVKVEDFTLLSTSLRPMPEKYHGLKDVEQRFRQRYLDLIANDESRQIFKNRSLIVKTIRQTLDNDDFLEVETPMLQSLFGGAVARPFTTHHNALDMELFMRIAPELYLKRLLVGGMEKVYELNRNFRNEGLSRRHNPEFTMLEVYSAYDNYHDMMDLCEKLIQESAKACGIEGASALPSGKETDLLKPFRKIPIFDAVKEFSGLTINSMEDLKAIAVKEELEDAESLSDGEILVELFERYVEEKLIEPTFITHYPAVVSPLAKPFPDNPDFAERFELFIDGQEVANAYSELNDPILQKQRFEEQLAKAESGEVSRSLDEDYIFALEHAMPPAGGLGIGIDRLVMMITGASSIREVILFPLLRNQEH